MKHEMMRLADLILTDLRAQGCFIDYDDALEIAYSKMKYGTVYY